MKIPTHADRGRPTAIERAGPAPRLSKRSVSLSGGPHGSNWRDVDPEIQEILSADARANGSRAEDEPTPPNG
jgi:hypothetical protein